MHKYRILGVVMGVFALVLASGLVATSVTMANQGNLNANANTNTSSNSNSNTEVEDDNGDDNNNDNEVKPLLPPDQNENDNEDDNEIDDQDGVTDDAPCVNTLINGHLYKIGTEATVYMSSHCVLKPFRGEAVFKSRGLKFENITTFTTLPAGVTTSIAPVLPADGTLVKGKDKTVWFVDNNGHRRGFISADVFTKLGFKFDKVQDISDSDLNEIPTDTDVADANEHPNGSLIKCGNSADVFIVIGGEKFPFANADAFKTRGHSFDHILNVDCGRFNYTLGHAITK